MFFDNSEHVELFNHAEMMDTIQARCLPYWQHNALVQIHKEKYGVGKDCRFCYAAQFDNIAIIFNRPAREPRVTVEKNAGTTKIVVVRKEVRAGQSIKQSTEETEF